MKPFDLELAKQGAPVCTKMGSPVRILCFDKKGDKYPIVGLMSLPYDDYRGEREVLMTWTEDGETHGVSHISGEDDYLYYLYMVGFNDDESCLSDEFLEKLADKIAERLKPQEPEICPFPFPKLPSDGRPYPYPPRTVMYGVQTAPFNSKTIISTAKTDPEEQP